MKDKEVVVKEAVVKANGILNTPSCTTKRIPLSISVDL